MAEQRRVLRGRIVRRKAKRELVETPEGIASYYLADAHA